MIFGNVIETQICCFSDFCWVVKILAIVILPVLIFPPQESYMYKDPITEFVECLYVNFDFDSAQKKLRECEAVSKHRKNRTNIITHFTFSPQNVRSHQSWLIVSLCEDIVIHWRLLICVSLARSFTWSTVVNSISSHVIQSDLLLVHTPLLHFSYLLKFRIGPAQTMVVYALHHIGRYRGSFGYHMTHRFNQILLWPVIVPSDK